MKSNQNGEYSVFLAALEIADPSQRADYLNQACADEPALRNQVDALFAAHERSGEFLNVPALRQIAAGEGGNGGSSGETSAEHHASQAEIDLSFLEPSTAPDSIGRLRHYDIHEVIGRGGCGIVLKAFDEKLHRIVAVKVMAPELAATSPARKRFLREARATAAIRHENVVSIHAVEEQPLPFLVMEYIDGQTLQQKLDQHGPLDVREVLQIGRQIAAGLEAAHAKGLIHRDIKPGNILLEVGSDHIKITDFGLARSADDASMTQSGVISGTPLYMSPEQAQAHEIDHRSDLFSLGSVLYVMCSGRPPFRAATSLAVLRRVVEEQPRPIQGIIPEVPQWLTAIIARLHAKNPEERFATAKEIGDHLARCLSELQQYGRVESLREILPMLPQPEAARQEPKGDGHSGVVERLAPVADRPSNRRWVAAAAMILVLLTGLGMSEATGVTNVRGTVIRLFSPEGTLVVEVDDPGVSVTIDGEELVITGAGAKEIRLKPGQYQVLASKDGKVVSQELVTVTENGRQLVRVSKEDEPNEDEEPASPTRDASGFSPEERKTLEWVLSHGGILKLSVNGVERDYREGDRLPEQPFRFRELNLSRTITFNKASLENLKTLPKVETTVSFGPAADDEIFAKLASYPGIANASHVGLSGSLITDDSLVHFAKFPNISEMYLMDTQVSTKGIAYLDDVRTLGLYLTGCQKIDDEACVVFNSMPNLHWLHLDGTSITDAGLAKLTGCPKLSSLRVRSSQVTAAGVQRLAAVLPRCKIQWDGGVTAIGSADPDRRAAEHLLSLPGADQQGVQVIAGGRWLTVKKPSDLPAGSFQLSAVMGTPPMLDDHSMTFLRGCHHLETLRLWNTRITPTGMAVFKDCRKIQTLSLIGNNIDDAALEPFQGLRLKTLHVQGPATDAGLAVFKDSTSIETLSLIGKRFTETGLNHFKGCTNLTKLTLLEANAVTDEAVEILGTFRSLKTLTLKGTKMTETGVQKLTATLPECKIEWDGGQN